MRKILAIALLLAILLAASACNLGRSAEPAASGETSPLSLTVQVQNATDNFNTVGQVIDYNYSITNAGSNRLAGPVILSDPGRQVNCPDVTTVGNGDGYLDPNETIICTGTYSITQADLDRGSVTNNAVANLGGVDSNPASATVMMRAGQTSPLRLTKTANPTTYTQVGQTIVYTYVITNTGTTTLGPTQFTISDNRLGNPFNCGAADTVLTTNATVTCTANYVITQADMGAASLTNSATASGGGVPASAPASATVTNLNITPGITVTPSTPSNLPPGTTIQHQVVRGEWLIQIARCYGASFEEVRKANPQITNPHLILPAMIVSVPRIGSAGTIYGPPCIATHTVQSGETWESIARQYNADVKVLQVRNPGALSVGRVLFVPRNSAGGAGAPVPPQVIRLTIPPGATSVTQQGTLPPQGIVRYVLAASQGQIMNVVLTAPATGVTLGVYNPSGSAIKVPDSNLSWGGTIPQTGDYRIDIANNSSANVLYTLQVSLSAAAPTFTPTPTATATSTPPTPTVTATATPTTTASTTAVLQQAVDINPGPGHSRPAFLVEFNGVLYFQADGGDGAGNELWKFDGTTASRAADINSGANSSNPAYLTVYNGALYFGATGSDGAGNELWKFDGTNATRVADLWSGPENSNPGSLIVFNGLLYFSANGNDNAGYELWKFDGTTASRAADILSGTGSSTPMFPAVYNGALYFQADGGDGAGHELWKFDGTSASRVADIWNGAGNSNPSYLAVYNGILYFNANGNDGAGSELWKYDGTNVGRATDIWGGVGDSNPTHLAVYNGLLYFNANGNDGGGQKLWRYDGTNASRVPEPAGTNVTNPSFLAVYKNMLYFQADGNTGAGLELWRYSSG